ncbi:Rv3654c family TadE-like protein [Bogoriella caseilytica]|uniref:Secretion/DNA translocation related TadE-like protein n=1 Tax=Bogoriella caseilytica TaxID=56055 RepID=A0A3N2BD84_9MICO|nr:Rv3654c family TadE-like protein [Bogoriella caseilytica]ROR73206.1 secretion/DNA translocation related TadE-like protein [Bogoriella caseilytica]
MTHALARGDRGSGTVLAVALVGVLAACALAVASVGAAVDARGRAQAAADLAALAAASSLYEIGGPDPCVVAAQLAQLNSAELRSCTVRGHEVEVTATVTAQLPGRLAAHVEAQARAGPA